MITQLIGFILCSYCFLTIGSLVKKFANWTVSYFHDFLIGLAISNAFFTLVSLSYPINNTVAFLFITSVTVLLFLNLNYEKNYFRQLIDQFILRTKANPALFFLLSLFVLLSFFQSLYSPSLHYDSGLYHVPAIKWTAEHKTIRGLVHLNSFLGYNFNIFSLDAAFYTVFQQPVYPINFTITCFFSAWIVTKLSDAIKLNQYALSAAYLLMLYYLMLVFWPHISTPSTDTLVFVLSALILLSVADLKENKDATFSIIILSAYVITVKLSAAPVLLVALYVFLTKYCWIHKKQTLVSLLICGFILLPWMVKNVLLTGWLLFPFPAIDLFSFDWEMPVKDVISLKEAIRNYYVPGVKSGTSIMQSWLLNQTGADLSVIILSSVTLVLLLFRLATKKILLSTDYIAVISISIFGVLFIYLNSPSLRYGSAFFLALIVFSIKSINDKSTVGKYGFYLFGIIVMFSFLKDNWFHPWHFTKHIASRFFLPYPLVLKEKTEFAYFLIDKEIKCYYPITSDQCFEHSLPCASRKIDGLHLRGNDIEQGFYRATR